AIADVPRPSEQAGAPVAFAPAGYRLATGHAQGAIKLWDITPLLPFGAEGRQGAGGPEVRPFVILARGGKAERPFATLAGAAADAGDGDTIEIRGDGPFVTGPIDLHRLRLTL